MSDTMRIKCIVNVHKLFFLKFNSKKKSAVDTKSYTNSKQAKSKMSQF